METGKSGTTAERYEREREFHNHAFGAGCDVRAKAVGRFYSVSTSFVWYRRRLAELSPGRHILEYGCGPGSMAFELARRGSSVTGIDISSVAIELANSKAQASATENLAFLEMNAEELTFGPDRFDLICGSAILHHLDLSKAYSELARALRPEGNAIFIEPLGHNPLINLYRKLTPHLRTADEHPLLMKDLDLAKAYFRRVQLRFFQLQTFLAVPFRNTRFIRPLRQTLDAMDQALFRIFPPARKYAWQVIIELAEPIKADEPLE
jgi:ubiquinone/menaquinone biosynthesis C-methylase UbiE